MSDAEGNVVKVLSDGPYVVQGDVSVEAKDGSALGRGQKFALCRCGASAHKPFCDGTHTDTGFADLGAVEGPAGRAGGTRPATGPLLVTVAPGGPLLLTGSFDLEGSTGCLAFRDGKGALCRCGASKTSPLCDGSHKDAGFVG